MKSRLAIESGQRNYLFDWVHCLAVCMCKAKFWISTCWFIFVGLLLKFEWSNSPFYYFCWFLVLEFNVSVLISLHEVAVWRYFWLLLFFLCCLSFLANMLLSFNCRLSRYLSCRELDLMYLYSLDLDLVVKFIFVGIAN